MISEQQRQQWNAALGEGHPDTIAALQKELLDQIYMCIMNDDPNYREAGWDNGENK